MSHYKELYIAVNEMMCTLGRDGEINAHQKEVNDVMNVLWKIDGGAFDPDIAELQPLSAPISENRTQDSESGK